MPVAAGHWIGEAHEAADTFPSGQTERLTKESSREVALRPLPPPRTGRAIRHRIRLTLMDAVLGHLLP
jgi:hypothetical protein